MTQKVTTEQWIEIAKMAGIAIGIYVAYRLIADFFSPRIVKMLSPIGEAASTGVSDITSWFNGHTPVETTHAGFVLSSKYIDSNYVVDYQWMQLINKGNPGNAELFNQILEPNYRVKPRYRPLIDKEVSAVTIQNADALNEGSVL